MAAQAGIKFLLKVGKKDADPITIAGMRATQMNLNNELVDITNKDSEGARTLLEGAGMQALAIKASGIFTNSDVEESIRDKAFNRQHDDYCLFFPNGDVLEGQFFITRYDRSGDYNGEETYNISLESSGKLIYSRFEVV
jgi:TP901-1 family phage major tail protein